MIGEYESVGNIIELAGIGVAEVLLIRIRTSHWDGDSAI